MDSGLRQNDALWVFSNRLFRQNDAKRAFSERRFRRNGKSRKYSWTITHSGFAMTHKGALRKTAQTFFLALFLPILTLAQPYPRDQHLAAGEYFFNDDPGPGNGIPIPGQYGFASINVTLNFPSVPLGTYIYVRFQSTNGTWSAPRAILNQIPYPNSGSTLVYGEYYINDDPGIGSATPVTIGAMGVMNLPNLNLNPGDLIGFRVKDSFGRWSAVNSEIYQAQPPNQGATLVYAEYFLNNNDPGLGNATSLPIGPNGLLNIPSIMLNEGDIVRFRVKDSYNRWSAAASREYEFKEITGAQMIAKYISGDSSAVITMEIQPNANPFLAYYTAIGSIAPANNIDSIFVRMFTEDYIVSEWTKVDCPILPQLILSTDTLNFGTVSISSTEILPLTIHNISSVNRIVSSVYSTNPPVFYTNFNPSDSLLTPGESLTIDVTFDPASSGEYNDTLYIVNNSTTGTLTAALLGFGSEGGLVPDSVENLTITANYPDAVLNWDEVTTAVTGEPIEVDYYLIFFEEDYSEEFNFLDYTADTTYTHPGVVQFSGAMFYFVEAYIGDIGLLDEIIQQAEGSLTKNELEAKLKME